MITTKEGLQIKVIEFAPCNNTTDLENFVTQNIHRVSERKE